MQSSASWQSWAFGVPAPGPTVALPFNASQASGNSLPSFRMQSMQSLSMVAVQVFPSCVMDAVITAGSDGIGGPGGGFAAACTAGCTGPSAAAGFALGVAL